MAHETTGEERCYPSNFGQPYRVEQKIEWFKNMRICDGTNLRWEQENCFGDFDNCFGGKQLVARETTGEERCNHAKQKLWWLKNKEELTTVSVVYRTHTTQPARTQHQTHDTARAQL